MNHRNIASHKRLLWLAVGVALIVLGVLLVRPPAWATPLPAMQRATHLQAKPAALTVASAAQLVSDETMSSSSASHLILQADTPNSDNCIVCHTDKKKLKKLAVEPEKVKSEEAEGEG